MASMYGLLHTSMAKFLFYFQCNLVRRLANFGAHLCAKNGGADRQRCAWINMVPIFLKLLTA
jgi:hypothetical protein